MVTIPQKDGQHGTVGFGINGVIAEFSDIEMDSSKVDTNDQVTSDDMKFDKKGQVTADEEHLWDTKRIIEEEKDNDKEINLYDN